MKCPNCLKVLDSIDGYECAICGRNFKKFPLKEGDIIGCFDNYETGDYGHICPECYPSEEEVVE